MEVVNVGKLTAVGHLRACAETAKSFVSGLVAELAQTVSQALEEMEKRAEAMGANAVVGVDVDYEVLGADNGMLMVSVSGTAVVCE